MAPTKDWIQCFPSGGQFHPMDPRADEINIEDIAHHLSNICRFTGGVRTFYSVAEHSCLVALAVPPEDRLAGLLHDASEAYLADVASPVKRAPEMAGYRAAEDRLLGMILTKYGCAPTLPASVHEADLRMLATEAHLLKRPLHPDWHLPVEPYDNITELGLSPFRAKDWFLRLFGKFTNA